MQGAPAERRQPLSGTRLFPDINWKPCPDHNVTGRKNSQFTLKFTVGPGSKLVNTVRIRLAFSMRVSPHFPDPAFVNDLFSVLLLQRISIQMGKKRLVYIAITEKRNVIFQVSSVFSPVCTTPHNSLWDKIPSVTAVP